MSDAILVAKDVTRTFRTGAEPVHALRGIDLEVQQGTFVVLRGRSGSGKTTLLNILGGLDRPDRGAVHFEGREIASLADTALTDLRRHRMGFVFQSFALLPTYSAYENVELSLRLAGVGRRERKRRTLELLSLLGIRAKADHRTFELSGGEQQRVAIARALANHPTLLLADEPTGDLDSVTGDRIVELIRGIVDTRGVTVVMSTHDPLISEVADVTYLMSDGRLSSFAPDG